MPTYGVTSPTFSHPVVMVANWWTTPYFSITPTFSHPARIYPVWEGGDYFGVPINGVMDGLVYESGFPVGAGVSVLLLLRANGMLIARTETDSNSYFAFYNLDPTTPATPEQGKYAVVYLDPKGGLLYEAVIHDRAVPRAV